MTLGEAAWYLKLSGEIEQRLLSSSERQNLCVQRAWEYSLDLFGLGRDLLFTEEVRYGELCAVDRRNPDGALGQDTAPAENLCPDIKLRITNPGLGRPFP